MCSPVPPGRPTEFNAARTTVRGSLLAPWLAEPTSLVGGDRFEGGAERVVAFEFGMHEKCVQPPGRPVCCVVGEQCTLSGLVDRLPGSVGLCRACDVFADRFGVGDAVRDHDQHRRRRHRLTWRRRIHPLLVLVLVAGVESADRATQLVWQREPCQLPRVSGIVEVAPFDVFARGVVGDRHLGDLDETGFDGVHEREVRHDPREHVLAAMVRLDKDRCGGEVVDDRGETAHAPQRRRERRTRRPRFSPHHRPLRCVCLLQAGSNGAPRR